VTRNKLLEAGVSKDELSRVRSPMGLELNAETPEEIAVSIMAEIIMLRAGGDGRVMAGKRFESGGESQSSEKLGEG
jgi:xanthine dehydrogenase accessory factor